MSCSACPLSAGGTACRHLQPLLSHLGRPDVCSPAACASHLSNLWCIVAECPAARLELARAVTIVSSAVDRGAHDSAYTCDPRKAHNDDIDIARRMKRQKVDEDDKSAIVQTSISQGFAKTSRSLLVADDRVCPDNIGRWDDDHLLTTPAASWLSFARVEHLSVAGDASRLGNPAGEAQVMLACNLDSGRACWLPPQVFMVSLLEQRRESPSYGSGVASGVVGRARSLYGSHPLLALVTWVRRTDWPSVTV